MVFGSIGLKGLWRPASSVRGVLLLAFVMILVTVASATAVLLDLRQKELARAKTEIVSLTRILSDQTARTFDGVVLTMRGAQERLSDKFGSTLELDSRPVHLLLRARVAGLPQVKSIFLVDHQGFGANSSRPDFIQMLSMSDREFFRYFAEGGRDEIFIGSPEKAHVDGQWTYYVSMPLHDSTGGFRGLVVAAINISYFETLYESISRDFFSRILLFNSQGALLAGKPGSGVMFGQLEANPAALAELRTQPKTGVAAVIEKTAGETSYVSYRQVAKYPLLVSAAISEDEALAPWRQIVGPIVAGVMLVIVFVLLTTALVVRNFLRKEVLKSALRERGGQLRHMVQSARDGIVTINAAKRIVLFNNAAERMFGVGASEAISHDVEAVLCLCLPTSQRMSLLGYLEEGWKSPAGLALFGIIELWLGEQGFPVELSLTSTTYRGEILLTAVFRDLTERKRAEYAMLETNRQLQELSAALQNVREEERTRIARELHDELGQLLSGIRMEVSWLGGRLLPEQQLLIDKINAVKEQIDQTVASVRRISSDLRPLVLDDLGFDAAAGWYVDQYSARTGLQVSLMLPEASPEQDRDVATALFRVLQECLTNIVRHAEAKKVEIELRCEGGAWLLSIRDDGVGFSPDLKKHGSFGLIGMRERVQILGGRFAVTTALGEGTLIELVIPVKNLQERL